MNDSTMAHTRTILHNLTSRPSLTRHVGFRLFLVAAWLLVVSCNADAQVREIGSQRQLFLDDWIIDGTENVHREQGTVVKSAGNPILVRDKPWDAGRCDLYGSAVYHPDMSQLQVFYSAVSSPTTHDDRLAYAVSNDEGATWTKRDLGLIPFNGDPRTNLVLKPTTGCYLSGPCVFLDLHETDPAKRYKMFTSEYNGVNRVNVNGFLYADPSIQTPESESKSGMYVAYSPDGLRWTRPSTEPFSTLVSDTAHSVLWDARLGKYVAYVRAFPGYPDNGWPGLPRSVGRMESSDFETWTEPQLVLRDPADREIYSMGVTPYQGIYVGTPWIFDLTATGDEPSKPVIWPELAVSRDGVAWSQPFAGQPFIPTGEAGSADFAQIRMSSSIVVLEDKLLLIYGQTDRGHVTDMRVDVGMATMRRDGFAAMVAGETEGSILTKPLQFQAGRLCINAVTEPDGFVKAELVDSANRPLAGYELKSCRALTGDLLDGEVVWDGKTKVPEASGDGCRIRFVLKNARLYSFWIAEQ